MVKPDTIVWEVIGPTAEWADGVGPLAYFPTRKAAMAYIRDEKAFLKEADLMDVWPYNQVDFYIQKSRASDYDINPADFETEEDLFEYLNSE